MRLIKISDKIRPLTLAAGIFSGASLYACQAVDRQSIVASNSIWSNTNMQMQISNGDEQAYLEPKFRIYLQRWKRDTMFMSSPSQIIENESFLSIISMGKAVVPYILYEINKQPSTLVWALNMIFQKKITNNPNATITDACKLWVKELSK